MAIASINNVSFGKKAYTKNGNEYEKTHRGLIAMGSMGAVSAASLLCMPKMMKNLYKNTPMAGFDSFMPKKYFPISAVASLASALLLGFFIDYMANGKKADAADLKAKK